MNKEITYYFKGASKEEIDELPKENVIGQLCDMANFKFTGVPVEKLWVYPDIAEYFDIKTDDFVKDYNVLKEDEKQELGIDYLYRPVNYEWDRVD